MTRDSPLLRNHEDILCTLKNLGVGNNSVGDLSSMSQSSVLVPFAHLETRRTLYRKDEVNIAVDVTDWGYCVGEIEIVVEDNAAVPEAVDRIEAVAKELGEYDQKCSKCYKTILCVSFPFCGSPPGFDRYDSAKIARFASC